MERAAARFLVQRETEMDCTPQTLKWYRQKLAQLERETGVTDLAELSRDHLLDFISGLRKAGRSPHYVRGWYGVFRAFIGWAREERLDVHPSLVRDGEKWFAMKKPIETEADIEIFSDEDLERIYEAARTQPRNVVFCQLLAGTGLRLSEALSLTLDDLQDDRLRVRQGKGRKPRWVPMSRQLRLTMDRYIERARGEVETDRLFPNRSGQPWSRSSAEELMARIRRQTGLQVNAHAFRHTFATVYLKRGGEIDRLRRILGHGTFAMTVKYARHAGLDLSRGIDQLTPF
jgi:integrase/recombinase XerD